MNDLPKDLGHPRRDPSAVGDVIGIVVGAALLVLSIAATAYALLAMP